MNIPEPTLTLSKNKDENRIHGRTNMKTLQSYAKKSINEYMGKSKQSESFVPNRQRLSYEPKDYLDIKPTIDFRQMDPIQQFFLLSATTLGLYLLYQGLYKKR